MKKILVTGANGFFGKEIFQTLQRKNYEAIKVIRKSANALNDEVICNFQSLQSIESVLNTYRPYGIIHSIGSFSNDLTQDFEANTLITWNLLTALVKVSPETKIVLIGSAAEYGIIHESENPVPESKLCKPVSVHGFTKLLQTNIGIFFSETQGLDIKIARVFNLTGKGGSERLFIGRLDKLIEQFKNGEIKNFNFGNLDSERDYLPIEKASEYIVEIMEHGKKSEVYNIGSGISIKMRDLLLQKLQEAGIDFSYVNNLPEGSLIKKNDVPVIYADITKISELMKKKI